MERIGPILNWPMNRQTGQQQLKQLPMGATSGLNASHAADRTYLNSASKSLNRSAVSKVLDTMRVQTGPFEWSLSGKYLEQ